MNSILLAALLTFTGACVGTHYVAASEFGPAKYNDRCSLVSEIIGHPVPGYSDEAHEIINEYPIGLSGDPHHLLIGYIYTTRGGMAYFVPGARAYQLHVTTASDNTSIPIGKDSLIQGATNLAPPVVKTISVLLQDPRNLSFLNGRNPACFSQDWNGRYHD